MTNGKCGAVVKVGARSKEQIQMVHATKFGSAVALVAVALLLCGCGSMKEYALTPSDEYVRESDIMEINLKPIATEKFHIDVGICNISDDEVVITQPETEIHLYPRFLDEMTIKRDMFQPAVVEPLALKPGGCFSATFDLLMYERKFEAKDGRYECRLIYQPNISEEGFGFSDLLTTLLESEPFYLVIRKNELVRVEWE